VKAASTKRLNKATDCSDLKQLVEPVMGRTIISKPKTKSMKESAQVTQPENNKKNSVEEIGTFNELREQVMAQGEAIRTLLRDKSSLSETVKHLKTTNDLALGRNRNVVIKGIPEPFMRESKQRERAIRYHVTNLLRMAGVPGTAVLKRLLRLGKWRRDVAPRPVVVEFANPRLRDKFLARAAELSQKTEGRFKIEPDDAAGWKHKSTGPQQVDPRTNPVVRVSKLPGTTSRPKPNTVTQQDSSRLADPTQGSLDGWVLVGTRRPAIKNGERTRT
jgi:hypothetical protein